MTGNATGSYTMNIRKAEENLVGNWDLLEEAMNEFDLKELKKSKAYKYDKKFDHEHTAKFASFDELEKLAKQQWMVNGSPYIKQVALYNEKDKACRYYYEPSCDRRVAIV